MPYTPIQNYQLLHELILEGLNERNQEAGRYVVDNYMGTSQYEKECESLYTEFEQIQTESESWYECSEDLGEYPNASQLSSMYKVMNGICRFASPTLIQQSTNESEIDCGNGTIEKNGQCVVDPNYKSTGKLQTKPSSRGGGCLIATATYGSELAPQVQQLRELRDNQLLSTTSGTNFMNTFNDVYYSFSPIIADYERENPVFKEMVKIAITPMMTSLALMEYADSESKVLGIGISLILLNGMMYVGIPIIAVMRFRK